MVEGKAAALKLGHSAEIFATVSPFGGIAQTSLKLVPAGVILGSAMVSINGAIINLGQPNAPLPMLTDLAALATMQAAAADAAAAEAAAAEAATAAKAANAARIEWFLKEISG